MTGWDEDESHPVEGTLLLYLDGELLSKEAALIQEHLTACWSCRMKADRVEEAVFAFVEYRDEVLRPLTGLPPSDDQVAGRLRLLGNRLGKRSCAQLYGVEAGSF
jgi:predicted anti-sigma-YlaC factor YlaD